MPVIDLWDPFIDSMTIANDTAMRLMAADIDRLAKMIAPVKSGELYSSGKHYRVALWHWRISFGENSPSDKYAAYQEAGMRRDGSHVVSNYTKPGTGAHFLEIAASNVSIQAPGAFKTANATIGRGLL